MNNKFDHLVIDIDASVFSALRKMDELHHKLLLVYQSDLFINILSIGDIQRAIIGNYNLNESIRGILRKNTRLASISHTFEDIKAMMIEHRMEICPILNEDNMVVDVVFWSDLFPSKSSVLGKFDIPVVIMAGGIGSRLRPLTYVLPKPLIPINNKTFLEEIFDRFSQHGCKSFFISLNYKADLIQYYISQLDLPLRIDYFIEENPSGTAGSLALLKNVINETFFVSNCDILIDQDYYEILLYHKRAKNDLTIVSVIKQIPIEYGTIESGDDGILEQLVEKPSLTIKINSGMYVLEPHLLNLIPDDRLFHITDLIEVIQSANGRVGVFPISEKSWIDIGNWKEYAGYLMKS
jgi:dTDP-glucose pyrophosphorylase